MFEFFFFSFSFNIVQKNYLRERGREGCTNKKGPDKRNTASPDEGKKTKQEKKNRNA